MDRFTDKPILFGAFDNPSQGADHASRQSLLQARGIADSEDELADLQLIRITKCHEIWKILSSLDADDRQVIGGIDAALRFPPRESL